MNEPEDMDGPDDAAMKMAVMRTTPKSPFFYYLEFTDKLVKKSHVYFLLGGHLLKEKLPNSNQPNIKSPSFLCFLFVLIRRLDVVRKGDSIRDANARKVRH